MKRWLTAALLWTLASAAPAVAQTAPAREGADARSAMRAACPGPDVSVAPSVLPLMRVSVPCEPSANHQSKVGGYTRIFVAFQGGGDEQTRWYRDSRRDKLDRFFAGKSVSRALTVKAVLARPQVGGTASLVTVGRDSNRKEGEIWSTELGGRRILTPYFRIDPDSTVNVELALSATSRYDATLATDVLNLVRRATALAAPSSALLTSLNSERYAQASQFIEQAVTSFFRESIVERATNDFAVRNWAGHPLAVVELRLPMNNEIAPPRAQGEPPLVGRWVVWAEPVRLSIFSDALIEDTHDEGGSAGEGVSRASNAALTVGGNSAGCVQSGSSMRRACEAFVGLAPESVLNFPVDDGVTLAQALAGDAGVTAARDALVRSEAPDRAAEAGTLCNLVANRAQKLGLNRIDVAATLWAYGRGDFGQTAARGAIQNVANCPALQTAYELGLSK